MLYESIAPIFSFFLGYPPDTFLFKVDVTPLSNVYTVVLTTVLYLSVIFGTQKWMSENPGIKYNLKSLLIAHNFFLSAASGLLLVLILENILPKLLSNGLVYSVCDNAMLADGRLEFLYYLNYLLKYYEFVDTIFIVLHRKPLDFLHYFHHSMTMLLCYTQLRGTTIVQWVPITINLFVHVVMYYYYAQTALGARIWWKKYLTTLQITQFVIDIVFCVGCTLKGITYRHFPQWAIFGNSDCAGDINAAYFGTLLLSSYLLLFLQFFSKTYTKRACTPKKEEEGDGEGNSATETEEQACKGKDSKDTTEKLGTSSTVTDPKKKEV